MTPSGPRRLRIAARHSDLARLQAYRVGDRLKAVYPTLEVEYAFRASLGDKNLEDPLWKMPEKGVFTEDFVHDLKNGEADLVVHSWKDLPTEARPGLEIAATLPRADQRDLLLIRKDRFEAIRETGLLRILTSSPRRAYNLDSFLKTHLPFEIREVKFENVRGNIPTRLGKLLSQDVEGLVVAKAALDRLLEAPEPEFEEARAVIRKALEKSRWMVLPLTANPTAAAQGALAIEIAESRADLRALLEKIHCEDTARSVKLEREILSSYGGGCHQKIGVSVLSRSYGDILFLQGLTDKGQRLDAADLNPSLGMIPAYAEEDIFPRASEEPKFFSREELSRDAWSRAESEAYLWVARETAWPKDLRAREDAVVWVAGLATWRKLAKRGVWVSGSSEGLGERESERVDTLGKVSTGADVHWLKLTHEKSAQGQADVCATYRLVADAKLPDMTGRTHFYWASGSQFDRALELYPEIREAFHASGPGRTNEYLMHRLGVETVPVYLNADQFRRAVLGSASSENDVPSSPDGH